VPDDLWLIGEESLGGKNCQWNCQRPLVHRDMHCRESRIHFSGQFRAAARTLQASTDLHSGSFQGKQSVARRTHGPRETIPAQRVSLSKNSVVALEQLASELFASGQPYDTSQGAHCNLRAPGGPMRPRARWQLHVNPSPEAAANSLSGAYRASVEFWFSPKPGITAIRS
jgi:hypothetical protein